MTVADTVGQHPSFGGEPSKFVMRAAHLSKTYETSSGNVEALRDVSLEIPYGEFTSVMGLSGSGKSTLVHLLAGLDASTSGDVWIDDIHITGMKDQELSRLRSERIGFVFQSFNLLPNLTVQKNMELPMDLWGKKPDQDWLDHVIDLVGIRDKLDQLAVNLSGGQRQRVAIARALASRPSVIVADEPTGALDLVNRESVLDLFRLLADDDHTVLMVTHDPEAASFSDRLLVLREGKIGESVKSPTRDQVRDLLLNGVQS